MSTEDKPLYIMVLNDGETFTDLNNCSILEVADGDVETIEEALMDGEYVGIANFSVDENGVPSIEVLGDTLRVTVKR